MSKPVSINHYHLGLGLSRAFLLLVGLGGGGSWFGVGSFWGVITQKKAECLCAFHSETQGKCIFLETKKSVSFSYMKVQS